MKRKYNNETSLDSLVPVLQNILSNVTSWKDWEALKLSSRAIYEEMRRIEAIMFSKCIRKVSVIGRSLYHSGGSFSLIITDDTITAQEIIDEAIKMCFEAVGNMSQENVQISLHTYGYEKFLSDKTSPWKSSTYDLRNNRFVKRDPHPLYDDVAQFSNFITALNNLFEFFPNPKFA